MTLEQIKGRIETVLGYLDYDEGIPIAERAGYVETALYELLHDLDIAIEGERIGAAFPKEEE